MPRGRQDTTAPGVHHLYRPPKRHLPTLGPQVIPITDREVVEALERAKRLREVRIAHARRDPNAFMEYCFLDDDGVPLSQSWFHEDWQQFITDNKRAMIIAPRGHGKTTQLVGRIIWELGRNPNLRIKIVCASDSKATDRLFEIVQHMNYNPRVREVFPKLVQADYGDFTKHKIVVRRTARHRDASVEALGIGATATGGRADILFADDVVDRRNALSFPALRESIKQSWRSDWTQLLVPSGKIVYICTLWHKKDLSHELMANPAFRVLRYDVTKEIEAIWPEVWSRARLAERRIEIGPLEFDRAYRNVPQDVSEGIVRPEFVRYTDTGLVSLDDIAFVLSYDVAIGQNVGDSYFACVVFAVDKRRKIAYVYDAYHARLSVPEQEAQVVADWQQFRADLVLVEGVGGFGALAQYLKRNHPGMPVAKVVPRGDKAARLSRVTPYMSAGQVLFDKSLEPKPDEHYEDRGDLVTELFDFPLAQNNDLCDAFSQGMDEIGMRYLDAVVDSTGATKIRVHTNAVHNVVKCE